MEETTKISHFRLNVCGKCGRFYETVNTDYRSICPSCAERIAVEKTSRICGSCGGECRHTEDIKHAKNFRNNDEYYIEEIKDDCSI